MSEPRTPWDERYAEGDWVDALAPSRILTDALSHLSRPGRALDLACGAGRNTLFLAERGWRVLGADLSLEGLRLLGRRARARELPILTVLADVGEFGVRPSAFDLVVNTFFLVREAFPLIREALRPGGILVFETFSVIELEELGGDIRRAFTLERGELLEAFGDFEVLLHEEGVFERDEGERGLVRLVARKKR
jgi:tellurite methyltransferase